MRLLLPALSFSCLVSMVHAVPADEQTIYMISGTQAVSITSGVSASTELSSQTRAIRVNSGVVYFMRVGPSGTTVTSANGVRKSANSEEYFKVNPTSGNYVFVTRESADGTLNLTEMKP